MNPLILSLLCFLVGCNVFVTALGLGEPSRGVQIVGACVGVLCLALPCILIAISLMGLDGKS